MIGYRIDRHEQQVGTGLHFFRVSAWWGADTDGAPTLVHDLLIPVAAITMRRYDDVGLLRRTVSGALLPRVMIDATTGEWVPIPGAGHDDDPWAIIEEPADRVSTLRAVIEHHLLGMYRRRQYGRDVFPDDALELEPAADSADVDALVGVVATIATETPGV